MAQRRRLLPPPVRPDGYGIYRHAGRPYGFFLEYDRGTMSARDYLQKFAAYYAYWSSGRYALDYDGFPTILVATSDNAADDRIARAAFAAAVRRGPTLPLLLTCRWRIDDARNGSGLLGPIWRGLASAERRCWPAPAPLANASADLAGRRGLMALLGRGPR